MGKIIKSSAYLEGLKRSIDDRMAGAHGCKETLEMWDRLIEKNRGKTFDKKRQSGKK